MKRFLISSILAALCHCLIDHCKTIDAWTNDASGKEIKLMEAGSITKDFDRRITIVPNLFNLDEN